MAAAESGLGHVVLASLLDFTVGYVVRTTNEEVDVLIIASDWNREFVEFLERIIALLNESKYFLTRHASFGLWGRIFLSSADGGDLGVNLLSFRLDSLVERNGLGRRNRTIEDTCLMLNVGIGESRVDVHVHDIHVVVEASGSHGGLELHVVVNDSIAKDGIVESIIRHGGVEVEPFTKHGREALLGLSLRVTVVAHAIAHAKGSFHEVMLTVVTFKATVLLEEHSEIEIVRMDSTRVDDLGLLGSLGSDKLRGRLRWGDRNL